MELGAAEADEAAENADTGAGGECGGIELGRVGTVMTESAVPSADGRITLSPLRVVPCRRFGGYKWTVPVA